MRKLIFAGAAIAALAIPSAAMADTGAGFDLSNVNPTYDVDPIDGGIQISNAVTSGSFSDWAFSNPAQNPAGESVANHVYKGEFKFQSATGKYRPGLQISVSPDNGQGARMSWVRLEDRSDGIHVNFAEWRPSAKVDDFAYTDIATVSRTAVHTLRFDVKMPVGPNNDQVAVYVDGAKKIVGKSWERYYRDAEGHEPGVVDRMLFQARTQRNASGVYDATDKYAANANEGYLITNVTSTTSVS